MSAGADARSNASAMRVVRARLDLRAPLALAISMLSACASSPAPVGFSPYAWEEDLPAKAALEREGRVERRPHVVAFFPRAASSPAERTRIASLLNKGIEATKSFLGARDWAVENDRRVYFYFADGQFVSHAPGGNTVYIPWWRIHEGKAPWLHEAVHVLLPRDGHWLSMPEEVANRRMPLWLEEGLAESIAMDVASREALPYYSPLIDTAPAELDRSCRDLLRAPESKRVAEQIGGLGKPEELFGPDRMSFARPFYVCSTSFVRYLRSRHGDRPLLTSIRAFGYEMATLERHIGMPMAEAKAQWLLSLDAAAIESAQKRIPKP